MWTRFSKTSVEGLPRASIQGSQKDSGNVLSAVKNSAKTGSRLIKLFMKLGQDLDSFRCSVLEYLSSTDKDSVVPEPTSGASDRLGIVGILIGRFS